MKKILLSLTTSSLLLFGAFDSPGTDYSKAITHSFTEEGALNSLDTVNDILSYIQQSRANEFLNEGNYTALIKDKVTTGSANTGTSGVVEKLLPMTLNVTGRTGPTDPMVVRMWLDIQGPDGSDMRIVGKIDVEKGVSTQYALGKFVMNFKGYGINEDGTMASEKIRGVLSVDRGFYDGQVEVNFKNDMNDGSNNFNTFESLSMNMNIEAIDTNTSDAHGPGHFDYEKKGRGVAYSLGMDFEQMMQGNSNPDIVGYSMSFSDQAYKLKEVYRNGPQAGTEEAYDKNKKKYKVYRYGLFDGSSGSKEALNSGFPFSVSSEGDYKGAHGYAGYYGLWSEMKLPNGTTVTKEGTSEQYTTTSTPGKLWKNTKTGILMSDLDGTKFFYNGWVLEWDNSGNGNFKVLGADDNKGGFDPNGTVNGVTVTSGSALFDSNTTTATGNALNINNWSKGWSEVLNAPISIRADYRNDTNASYHIQELVTSTDLNLTSFSFERVNTVATNAQDAVLMFDQNDSNFTIGRSYNFSANTMMLTDRNASDANVTISNDINLSGTQYAFGVHMSPLVEESKAGEYNATNFWTAFDADVFYSWETGPQEWNRFTGLKDTNGSTVAFDAPITLTYQHQQVNDVNNDTENNGIYVLQYDGFSLQTPWEYNAVEQEWQPKINIKSGTPIGSYRVKILEQGIVLGDDTTPGLEGHSNSLAYDANRTEYKGPDHNATDLNASRPTVAPVTVIKGECVEGNCSIPTTP